jgi:carbamoyl-phosphate synthase large subunit
MPRRPDLSVILVVGSGPIVIGQACEFDYSGTQAIKALREEGYRVVLVNSNPATIMTDPELADATYVEPLVPEVLESVIRRERVDALLATVGGQTALNLAMQLDRSGVLAREGVRLLGLSPDSLALAEDRLRFKKAMEEIGLATPRSGLARTVQQAEAIARRTGYPAIVRPSFTLGGAGGGIAYNCEELRVIAAGGLSLSPVHEVLVEESVIGWKEFELEVMRDAVDNFVVVCTIENFDSMGVHTGDSITVAPAQTLTDREYQTMRDAAARVIRRVGVETGGSNIQFAQDPATGRLVVIEMNPRVSRSSALASKATGFPIAKIAAKLAVGYTLDEIPNDITRKTPASFEPTLDYVVVKVPRWNMEKFPGADPTLTTAMKSVGETMAIGRTFKEAFQKALRGLELGRAGFGADGRGTADPDKIEERLRRPTPDRIWYVKYALQSGFGVERVAQLTQVDPWFISQLSEMVDLEGRARVFEQGELPAGLLRKAKRWGYSDSQIAFMTRSTAEDVRRRRALEGLRPSYKQVDTCGAEFPAQTPYFYSTYDGNCEVEPMDGPKVMILGAGPNRIGQGIEFDYCCCHAAFAARELGYRTLMVNCNPETVSTDYDTSDRLYFEPVTLEDVLGIYECERPRGVMLQFGGQTPLKLARDLARAEVPILGTSPDAIDLAEDRERFRAFLDELDIPQPESRTVTSIDGMLAAAAAIGYPVLVRPSYVLGGRGMFVAYDERTLVGLARDAVTASGEHPVLIDRYLEHAVEGDVDLVCDGAAVVIGGVMQHIEMAGVHSGDSSCVMPPHDLPRELADRAREYATRIALKLGVSGLMNMQFAVQDGVVYVLEVNPRASRTVPYVSKATGVPLAKLAAKVILGRTLAALGVTTEVVPRSVFVKGAVFSFSRFPGQDTLLGPEMRSTGEVMAASASFGGAFAKAQMAAGTALPARGTVFISVNDSDKAGALGIARGLARLGFALLATEGTARSLHAGGVSAERVHKVNEGRPNAVDHLKNGRIQLVINTPLGKESYYDEAAIRKEAVAHGVPLITTLAGAWAALTGIEALRHEGLDVRTLQQYHTAPGAAPPAAHGG